MNEVVNTWRDGRIGRIQLNRPGALNALDLTMVHLIHMAMDDFRDDASIHAVLVEAAGARAFCAGGDVHAVRAAGMAGDATTIATFFEAEYAMNLEIATYPKPFITLVDGICLGGGIGLSIHGSHRIATEHAAFAMPETAIALFPDVGTTYILPRLPGALGIYLGLTGARLTGADAVHAGWATHYVPRARLAPLAAAIARDGATVIPAHAEPLPPFALAPHRPVIDQCFAAESMPAIIAALAADGSDFALATIATLGTMSPSALAWSLRILREGAARTLPECLAAEFALVRKITMHPEFFEGVRAVLVDKDRAPHWHPATIEAVDPAATAAFFA